ncbi:MAG: hypothetical protein V3S32_00375 [Acidimicrobiia bacterium]
MGMTPDQYRERLIAALEQSNADRVWAFFPMADDHLPGTIRRLLEDEDSSPQDRFALLGGACTTCLMFASESVGDGEDALSRVRPGDYWVLKSGVWSILDMVALNARNLASEGVDGMKKLERRIGSYMLRLLQSGMTNPKELLDRAKFWTIVSVARGVLDDSQATGAEMGVASIMMEEFGIPDPGSELSA